MKNYTFYGILFTLSAYLCFLSACGEGEIIDLSSGSEWDEIKLATDNLTKGDNSLIAGCIKNPDSDPICNIEAASSSSEIIEGESSSSGGNETDPTSSQSGNGEGDSSSSNNGNTSGDSSSSVNETTPPSSGSSGSVTPTVSGELKFNNAPYSSSSNLYYYIGDVPTYEGNITVSNNEQAQCDDVQYRVYLGGTSSSGGTLLEEGGSVTTSASSTTNIRVEAYATCQGSSTARILKTATAMVVPDPVLSGTCVWTNSTLGGGKTARVTNAPTLANPYGRCTGPYFTIDGEKKTNNVSDGLPVDAWENNGTQTMTNIAISATCNETPLSIECPDITVLDPAKACEYEAIWCNGQTIDKVLVINKAATASNKNTNDDIAGYNWNSGGSCIFITTTAVTQLQTNSPLSNYLFNGKPSTVTNSNQTAIATIVSGIEPADGGYYMYIAASSEWLNYWGTTTSSISENCK